MGLLAARGVLADGNFQQRYADCVEKFANGGAGASVMLECTAGGGKLDGCKVKENTAPGQGYDRAALCIAEFLPIGTKTGPIQVPLKFAG